MHELGLCEDIVAAVEQRAGERPVARVTVRVGRLHHVHPEAFDQSFAMAAAGGVADGAAAQLVLLPVQVRCHRCGTDRDRGARRSEQRRDSQLSYWHDKSLSGAVARRTLSAK